MLVKDLFLNEKVDLDLLEEISEISEYKTKACNFIAEKWTSDVESLSEKQYTWMHNILEDAVEYRIENK